MINKFVIDVHSESIYLFQLRYGNQQPWALLLFWKEEKLLLVWANIPYINILRVDHKCDIQFKTAKIGPG